MDLPSFIPPFLTCMDNDNNELYILHREDPQYLIWVKQETPLRFILVEYYDDTFTPDEILAHPSLSDAKEYAKKILSAGFEKN